MTQIVSVVIPVFNRPHEIKEAVMSVLLQTYTHIEIIIVDDGSTDETSEVLVDLQQRWPKTIIIIQQANKGPGKAREIGTKQAIGEFIQYLDSDDLLLQNKFDEQVKALQQNPEAMICYGISYQADYSFFPPLFHGPLRSTGISRARLFPELLNERWWTTSCPLYRKKLVSTIRPWPDWINEEDWGFDAKAGSKQVYLIWVASNVSVRRINMSREHLSSGGTTNTVKLKDRVEAKHHLYQCALAAGVLHSDIQMKIFSRECFLIARQCAQIDLDQESKRMYFLSIDSATRTRRFGIDLMLFGLLGQLLGWSRVGRIASHMRSMIK